MPASDGATALRPAGDDVSAAVLDIGLPDADGRDVCQAIRANGFLAPVIFLTAHHRLTDRLSGFSTGGDDYLPKPFHLPELAARLRAAPKLAAPRPAATAGNLVLDPVRHGFTVHGEHGSAPISSDTPVRPRPALSLSRSAAVSPTVVHRTLMIQK